MGNGKEGILKNFNFVTRLWTVALIDGEVKRLRSKHLVDIDSDLSQRIGRPLEVRFRSEPARGPGVAREFVQLAMQAFLDQEMSKPFWEYRPEQRTYWFSEGDELNPAAFRACGTLLGHAIVSDIFIAVAFPEAVYNLLLHGIGSPHAKPWTLVALAKVSPAMASGLEKLIEYDGDNVADVFPLDWPRSDELEQLATGQRAEYVQSYVEWFFKERYAVQSRSFCEGFKAVVGHSPFMRQMVTTVQLEQIICGIEKSMDVETVRTVAQLNGWGPEDAEYLESFWAVLSELSPDDLRGFAIFVSASTRMPLKGWKDFHVQVQKNGTGDERLPTAYTCFQLLLLPLYSSVAVLKDRLLKAIHETQGFGLS